MKLFCLLLLISAVSLAQDQTQKPKATNKFTIDVGVGLSQSVMEAKQSGKVKGEMRNRLSARPVLMVRSPQKTLFGDKRIGYKFEFSYSSWSMHKQEVSSSSGNDLQDLGTSAKGFTLYALPALSYTISDHPNQDGKGGNSLSVGLGLGIGYVDVKGDIVMTEEPAQPTLDFDIKGVGFSVLFNLDYRWNNWMIGSQVGGPFIKEGTYTYTFFEITPRLTYGFEF